MKDQIIVTSHDELQNLITNAVVRAVANLTTPKQRLTKEVYSNREAMQFLRVSRSTLQRWRNDGILPYRKVNGSIRYTRSDLEKLLEESRI